MGSYTAAAGVVTTAIGNLGSGLLIIFGVVVGLVVGVFLFRKGLAWLKHSGK